MFCVPKYGYGLLKIKFVWNFPVHFTENLDLVKTQKSSIHRNNKKLTEDSLSLRTNGLELETKFLYFTKNFIIFNRFTPLPYLVEFSITVSNDPENHLWYPKKQKTKKHRLPYWMKPKEIFSNWSKALKIHHRIQIIIIIKRFLYNSPIRKSSGDEINILFKCDAGRTDENNNH